MNGSPHPSNSRHPGRKRFLRISTRGLLLLLTLFALGCAWVAFQAQSAREENRIVKELLSAEDGRTTQFEYGSRFQSGEQPGVPAAFFKGGPAWATRLLGVDIVRTPVSLQCAPPGNMFRFEVDEHGKRLIHREYKSGIRTADMRLIGRLRRLRLLRLEASPVNDEGLSHLTNLKELHTLYLSNTAVSDAGLHHLARLPRLKTLDLSRTDVSDECVDTLSSFPALKTLDLELSRVTQQGAERLRRRLPGCDVHF